MRTEVNKAAADGDRAQIVNLRTKAVMDQWTNHPGRNSKGMLAVNTKYGEVHIASIRRSVQTDGTPVLEISLDGVTQVGETHYRIVNPPLLVEDSSGPIAVKNRRFREDPLHAVALAIAFHGGSNRGRTKK